MTCAVRARKQPFFGLFDWLRGQFKTKSRTKLRVRI